MKIHILSSSSKGNITYIDCGEYKILIDVGLSMKKIEEKLNELNTSLSEINAILITHEHSDHIMGLNVILRKYNIKTYINKKSFLTVESKFENVDRNLFEFIEEEEIRIGDIDIRSVKVSHDASNCFSYILNYNNYKFTYITDTGYVNNVLKEAMLNSNAIAIESNYDYEMLMLGSYPPVIKNRINGKKGHLSNEDCIKVLLNTYSNNLEKIYVLHISQENNSVSKVKDKFMKLKRYIYSKYEKEIDVNIIEN